jgi:hypothetical protein
MQNGYNGSSIPHVSDVNTTGNLDDNAFPSTLLHKNLTRAAQQRRPNSARPANHERSGCRGSGCHMLAPRRGLDGTWQARTSHGLASTTGPFQRDSLKEKGSASHLWLTEKHFFK